MGFFNMGWGGRCDCCDEQVHGDIVGGLTKEQVRQHATEAGWIVKGNRLFCNAECEATFKDKTRPRIGPNEWD